MSDELGLIQKKRLEELRYRVKEQDASINKQMELSNNFVIESSRVIAVLSARCDHYLEHLEACKVLAKMPPDAWATGSELRIALRIALGLLNEGETDEPAKD